MKTGAVTSKEMTEFFAKGGEIKKLRPGTARGVRDLKYRGGMFGGKRAYVAGIAYRQKSATGDIFGSVSVPFVKGMSVK